jgi:hypothetical protein
MNDTPTLVSVREAAKRLEIPEQQLYRAIKRGTIRRAEGPEGPLDPICFTEEELKRYDAVRSKLYASGVSVRTNREIGGWPEPAAA